MRDDVRLSSREFDVMQYLMSSQGQIVPKEMILCRVWGFNSNAVENHVEVYIGLLRKTGRIKNNPTCCVSLFIMVKQSVSFHLLHTASSAESVWKYWIQ